MELKDQSIGQLVNTMKMLLEEFQLSRDTKNTLTLVLPIRKRFSMFRLRAVAQTLPEMCVIHR